MQKNTNRILSMLLALVMVLSMLPANVFATSETDALEGWNITLGDNIGVNFYLNSADYTVAATVNGETVTPTISNKVVTVNVAAAQMNDPIVLTVRSGEEIVHTGEYSVRQYADTILNGQYAEYVKDMVKEMLNYGAAAQTYFAYNTDNLANSGIAVAAATVPAEVPEVTVTDNLDGIGLYGMSLVFRNKTAVRFYFTVSGDISAYTFKVGETVYNSVEKNGLYYIEIDSINPQDIDKDITVSVNDGAMTVTYSPLNYIVRKYNNESSSAELKALVQALYGYHLEALEYIAPPIADVVDLVSHSNGWNSASAENPGGMTFAAAENDASYNTDWSLLYAPVSADAIKLIRGGETVSIGNVQAETIVKYSATEYYVNFWPFSQKPMQAGDEIILEGLFYNAANDSYINIEKTYFILNADSSITVIAGGYIDAGALSDHTNGINGTDGIYATMAANTAPYDGWSIEYTPVTSDAYSVIRNGETINIGIPGRGTLVKYGDTEYYLKLTQWCTDSFAFTTDDIFVISGFWKQNTGGDAIMKIEKTYLYYDGTAWVFAAELPTVVNAGLMQSHSNSHSTSGIYFAMDANDAYYVANDWSIEYTQTSVDNIKLIRNGETISIGIVDRPLIIKYGETDYYLKLEGWNVGDYAMNGTTSPITTDDVLIIEGDFAYAAKNVTLNITKSYVYYDGSAWVCSAEAPTPESTVVDVVSLSSHSNGWNSANAENPGGMTFAAAENDAPYATDWSLLYTPVSADAIKLIRGGETVSIGNTGAETIVKYSATEYYVNFWPFSQKPMQAGDEIILEGEFYNAANDSYINIEKTYLILNADNSVTVITGGYIDAGTLSDHANGIDGTNGVYATMAANTAPYDGWSIEYTPMTADAYCVIRNGETINIGIPGRGTLIKYSDTEYFLNLTKWCTDNFAFTTDDIFVISGFWKQNTGGNAIMKIEKTYLYYDSSAWIFSTILPTNIDAGMMSAYSTNAWSSNEDGSGNLPFDMADNDAPSGYYRPTGTSNVKVIRDGQTYELGHSERDTIEKIDDDQYNLAFWVFVDVKPLKANDIIIIEGDFYQASTNTTLNITKTYILLNEDGSATFSDTEPSLKQVVDVVSLSSHSNGWNSASAENPGGVYFTAAENDAPYSAWDVLYTPVSADAIKLIRNGETLSIGNTAAETIVKYSATEYYVNFWPFSQKPMQAGDEIILEGEFYNATNDTYINIEKTYLICNADGTVTVITGGYISAGPLSEHANGVYSEGIYATMPENAAPYDGWSIEYTPVTSDAYSVIRNGETINIGIPGRGTLVKYSDTEYALKINSWCTNNFAYTTDDIIVVGGFWKQNTQGNAIMKIEKTYLYHNGTAWVFTTEMPTIVHVAELGSHSNGWSSTSAEAPGGLYFTAPENDAPYIAGDWSTRYTPVSADTIKLIRDGETVSIANTGAETIVKYSATEYYVEFWPFSQKPMLAGDEIIIEGLFYNSANDTYIKVEKTYITLNADGTATIINDADKYIDAGTMGAYSTGWLNNGIYFAMASNDLPYNAAQEDWSVEYAPTSTAAIKLIRNGVTTESARVGAGTMIKLADGQYYMKIEGWTITSISSKDDLLDGDILVVEGDFVNESNGYTLHIDKSYITLVSMANNEVSFSTAADTEFGEVLLANSADTLTIGMWNGSYHVFEDKQLQELQAAGITKIVGIDTQWIGTTDVNAWLDRVYSYGISVIFDMRSTDENGNTIVPDSVTAPEYASHPGVLGFLMYDEPSTTEFEALAELKAKFDAVMPADKLFYVNLLASCVADSSLFGDSYSSSQTDYDTYYVTKFLETLDIQVLSWDNYSLISQADDTTAKGIRTDYFYNFEVMAGKASDNLPLWYIMLSAGHTSGAENTVYNTPTAEELRWQMAVALTYGVQNIDHYTYVSHADDYSCMVEYEDADGDGVAWETTALYDDIKTVNNEYLAWDNIFMAYDWVGVGKYSANSKDTMLDLLESCLTLSDYGISAVSASENLLVGVFEHSGSKAYMVTNAGSTSTSWFSGDVGDGREFNMADTTVTLTLDAADYKCVAVINNGQITYVAVENNTVTLNVEAYEGVFVIPVLN